MNEVSNATTVQLQDSDLGLPMGLRVALGLQQVPKSMQHLPACLDMLAVFSMLPVAVIAVVLNLILPEDES